MNLAAYFAQFLQQQGVTHVFGLPGGENVTVLEAMRQQGIEFVLTHHEATAGFAADVVGQLTDRPGVCLSTVGPGAVNLVAAVAGATLERSPMLAITAEIDSRQKEDVTHMKVDLNDLFASVTKGSFNLTPATAVSTLAKAWQLAMTPPRGAVHVAIAPDWAEASVTGDITTVFAPTPSPVDDKFVHQCQPYLDAADTVFILVGVGVETAVAQKELLALAEAWQVPVAVTPKAKGHFPESHPLFAGCFTAYGDAPLREAIAEADLVLGVGLDSVDFVTSTWDFATPVVNLNLAGADDPALQPDVAVNGDLRQMLMMLAETTVDFYASGKTAQTVVEELQQAIEAALTTPAVTAVPRTISIRSLIHALRTALPPDGAVTVDVGAFKLVFLQQWRTDAPKSLFVANGLSAMGYAIPGALGIRQMQPARSVVAVVGDGALLMYAGELATVVRLKRPLLILVVVDEALALIRLKQKRQDVPEHGTEFGATNYKSLAASFGLEYRVIDNPMTASLIFKDALQLKKPVLVEARINKDEYDRFR